MSCFMSLYFVALMFLGTMLKMISRVLWRIWEARIKTGSVVYITKAQLPQRKIVQLMGASVPPASVSTTDGSEHWTINGFLCAKVICDATILRDVAHYWITPEIFVIIFIFKNIFLQCVKRSGNKAANCLARLSVFQPGCMVSWGFVPTESLSSY